ncbi:MAG: helix-turn-helix domain-containing protein [Treponema sp.]|nr:helix-turn-helix domain-containing protein [Treponema sp.]
MLKPYNLLENVLIDIENGIKENINIGSLAKKYSFSDRHIRRLFRFAFKQPMASYIRSRKLASSLDDLLSTDINVLDIALNYNFGYEQSYIRSFKSEFGVTPGEFRKSGHFVKVKPPLHLFNENILKDGIIFGPDIVMVPKFHVAGVSNIIPFSKSVSLAPKAAINFWENERININNVKNPNVYIGLTCNINHENENSEYITSVQVRNLKNIPHGYRTYTFNSSLCARFRYIGQHHFYNLDKNRAGEMYNSIRKFASHKNVKYALLNDQVYFEKIDIDCYDGNYCQMEWFTPVIEKI